MKIEFFTSAVVRLASIPFEKLEQLLSSDIEDGLLNDLDFLEAVSFASVDLLKIISIMDNLDSSKKSKILTSLLKYYTRSATRTTPFGLFAGCSSLIFSDEEYLLIDHSLNKKNIEINLYHFWELISLCKKEILTIDARYCINNTLYKCGKKIRFLDLIMIDHYAHYQLCEIDYNADIYAFLKSFDSYFKFNDAVSFLCNMGYSKKDSIYVVDMLISNHLILSEYDLLFDPDEIVLGLIKLFSQAHIEDNRKYSILNWVNKYRRMKNRNPSYNECKKLESDFYCLFPEIYNKYLFHINLAVGLKCNMLGNNIKSDLLPAIKFLITYFKVSNSHRLDEFSKKFYSRYEDQLVPLCKVLDPDFGISYPVDNIRKDNSSLLDNISVNNEIVRNGCYLRDIDIILLKKIISNGDNIELILLDEDFVSLQSDTIKENIMSAYLDYAKFNINGNNAIYLKLLSGNSTKIINRFSFNNQISDLVKELSIAEELIFQEDKIIADIKFYNPSLGFNVVNLPHYRSYEIVYYSVGTCSKRVDVSDLYICLRNGKFVLYSKIYKKEVIPCLDNAHNYSLLDVPIYEFLCDMSESYFGDIYLFDWKNLKSIFNFFPRVVYKGIILSLATWILQRKDYEHLFSCKNDSELMSRAMNVVIKFKMPRYVFYGDPSLDNNLFIDWYSVESVKMLLSVIKSKSSIEVVEHMCNFSTSPFVDSFGNHYVNELVIPFSVV